MDFPESGGSKLAGWPTWTTPLMRWAKGQGAVTRYAHSANGLGVNPADAARRLLDDLDADKDGSVTREEAEAGRLPLPEPMAAIDVVRDGRLSGAERVNGKVAAVEEVPTDGKPHDLSCTLHPAESCWVALRQFPQLHTNPVNVTVGARPIRASRDSARWCAEVIEQLWRVRENKIDAAERGEAEKTFRTAVETYRRIAAEAPQGS